MDQVSLLIRPTSGGGVQIPNLPPWFHQPCITILGKMWYASTTGKNVFKYVFKEKNKNKISFHQRFPVLFVKIYTV